MKGPRLREGAEGNRDQSKSPFQSDYGKNKIENAKDSTHSHAVVGVGGIDCQSRDFVDRSRPAPATGCTPDFESPIGFGGVGSHSISF